MLFDNEMGTGNLDLEACIVWLAWGAVIQVLNLFACTGLVGFARTTTKTPATPEDAKFFGGEGTPLTGASDGAEQVERARCCHANTMESTLPWFIAAFVMLTGVSVASAHTSSISKFHLWSCIILNLLFPIVRVLYTISYHLSLQPYRTIFFGIGWLLITIELTYGAVLGTWYWL